MLKLLAQWRGSEQTKVGEGSMATVQYGARRWWLSDGRAAIDVKESMVMLRQRELNGVVTGFAQPRTMTAMSRPWGLMGRCDLVLVW